MGPSLNIQTFYPQNALVSKYVEFYYFLRTDASFSSSYYSFPNTLQALNIHRHAQGSIGGSRIEVEGNERYAPLLILQGKYNRPVEVALEGCMDKITILFKPVGISHFLSQPFSSLGKQPFQRFDDWNGPELKGFLNRFFIEPDLATRIHILENYLISLFREVPFADRLAGGVQMLGDLENPLSIEEIARHNFLSLRSFNRLFLRHVGISPRNYRSIERFRQALKQRSAGEQNSTLTQLAYASSFYDAAYFAKTFKNMAGGLPSRTLHHIRSYSDHKSFFLFSNPEARPSLAG